jgi:hypothetical protein
MPKWVLSVLSSLGFVGRLFGVRPGPKVDPIPEPAKATRAMTVLPPPPKLPTDLN